MRFGFHIVSAMMGVLVVLGLSSCGTTGSVLSLGPDTYKVTASRHGTRGGLASAEDAALEEANKYCQAQGRRILVTNMAAQPYGNLPSYSVSFRCLKEGDPELARPTYEASPTSVIEVRPR